MEELEFFGLLAVQPVVRHCNDRREIKEKNLDRLLGLLDILVPYYNTTLGAPVKLAVFPEFCLHGVPQNPDGSWNGVAIDIPGPETEAFAQKAKELDTYIAVPAWTVYEDFTPNVPFSVCFIVSPEGKIIHRHHKFIVTKIVESGDAAPADAYDWFTKRFGEGIEAFFPVTKTELGALGVQICGEGQYAEISRGLMMNGAEIIIRPNAWIEPYLGGVGSPQDAMALLSRFNAFANMCYLVEANWSYYTESPFWEGVGPGGSQIIDYSGRTLTRTPNCGETGVAAEVNMESLRRYREDCGFLARQTYMPTEIFRKVYEKEFWPLNILTEKKKSLTGGEWEEIRRQVIEKRRDVFTPSRRTKEQRK